MNPGSGAPAPALQIRQIAAHYFSARALHVAASIGIADRLVARALDIAELARATGCHEDALYRLLRALSSIGVFRETGPRRFENTPLSEVLIGGTDDSLRDLVLLLGHEISWRSWEALGHTIRTGEPAFEHVYGIPVFDYFAANPGTADLFDRAMASATELTRAAVSAYPFDGIGLLVDVAGGVGATLCSILESHPGMRGAIFDLPHVEPRALDCVGSRNLRDRCVFQPGNFFDAIRPVGADAYFMKHVLHDWGDDDCMRILRACRSAARASSRLLLCERLVPEGNDPSLAKWADLWMLVQTHGGRERTLQEYENLLARSGFGRSRVFRSDSPWSVIEARPTE